MSKLFRRAFERDKSLLRSFGYLIEYSNDKWSHDESGYTMGGSYVFNNIKKNEKYSIKKGHDIKMSGVPSNKSFSEIPCLSVALMPNQFRGVKPN